MTAILVNNSVKEKDIARQCSPLNNSIFVELRGVSVASRDEDQVQNFQFNIVALGCYIGPRLSKYAQTIQEKVNVHTYLSGITVMKAFVANDFPFYNKKQGITKDLSNTSLTEVLLEKIMWWIQKNHQNNQPITLVADMANLAICSVHSAMQIVLQAHQLNQPDDMPVAIYKTTKDKIFYLTGNKIAELLRKAIKVVHPDTPTDDLKKYSTHLLCVWGCVLLDEMGKSPKYIKMRLCWIGNSFTIFLRDTTKTQSQHLDALQAASQEVMDLIAALPDKVIAMCTMTDESDDPDMHAYADEMDKYISSSLQQLSAVIIIYLFHLRSYPLDSPILHNCNW
jgi:hypothetical protein